MTALHALPDPQGTPRQASPAGQNTVNTRLTPNRPRRVVENDEYAAFVRRVGDGDVEALRLLVGLAEEIDAAMAEAVKGLRAHGYSWAEIGARLGISRQAAQQGWE